MKKISIALILCTSYAGAQNPYSLNGNRSESEVNQVLYEDYMRQQKINQYIEENNRRTQQAINGLEDKLLEACMRQRPKQQPSQSSQQSQRKDPTPRNGIQFSVDEPRSNPKNSKQRQIQELQRRNRDAENLRNIAKQKARIAEQRQREEERARIAEQRRLQREHEEYLRRMQRYQNIRSQEYINAGVKSTQLSNEAHWRTHEGADILDVTHTCANLMYSNVEADFSSGRIPTGTHKLRSLRRSIPAITGLDPHAKPWDTFREWEAIPIDEQNTEYVLPLPKDTIPPIVVKSLSGWEKIESELSPDLLSNLRAALYHEFNGDIPPLVYDENTGKHTLYQHSSHKIVTISPDGSELTVHTLEEKDDSFKKIYDNIAESAKFNVSYNALDKIKGEVNVTPGKIGAGGKFNTYGVGLDISEKGIGINAGAANVEVKSMDLKNNNLKVTATYTDEKEISIGKIIAGKAETSDNDYNKVGSSDKKEGDLLKGEISAKIKAYENSTKIYHKKIYLSNDASMPSFSIEGNIGLGLEVGASLGASAHATLDGKLKTGAKLNIEATMARGGVVVTVMQKPPMYKGMCFLTAGVGAKAGYSYTVKRGGQKGSEVSTGRNLGALPIVLTGTGGLRCYNTEEINKAFETAKKNNR